MNETVIKIEELSTKVDTTRDTLETLMRKYNLKRHALYPKRNTNESVDEAFIRNLELKNDELYKIGYKIQDQINCIDTAINDLDKYIEELDLTVYTGYLTA